MTIDEILLYFQRLGVIASAKDLGEPRCTWIITVDLSADSEWYLEIEVNDEPPHSLVNASLFGPKEEKEESETLEQVELELQNEKRMTHDHADIGYYWRNSGSTTIGREVSLADQIGPIFGIALFISHNAQEWMYAHKFPHFGL